MLKHFFYGAIGAMGAVLYLTPMNYNHEEMVVARNTLLSIPVKGLEGMLCDKYGTLSFDTWKVDWSHSRFNERCAVFKVSYALKNISVRCSKYLVVDTLLEGINRPYVLCGKLPKESNPTAQINQGLIALHPSMVRWRFDEKLYSFRLLLEHKKKSYDRSRGFLQENASCHVAYNPFDFSYDPIAQIGVACSSYKSYVASEKDRKVWHLCRVQELVGSGTWSKNYFLLARICRLPDMEDVADFVVVGYKIVFLLQSGKILMIDATAIPFFTQQTVQRESFSDVIIRCATSLF